MQSIGKNGIPRVLLDRRRNGVPYFSPLLLNNGLRRSFSYHKLPQQLIKLSILKLDGSCFDVQVARIASVAELKQAVEDVFSQSPKEGQGKISWSHVWGHFCLCYEGQKLVNDKAYIQNFRIKDGDQLHFIRHLSITYNAVKRRSKTRGIDYKQYTMSSSESDAREEKELNGEYDDGGDDQEESFKHHYYAEEDEGFIGGSEFKLAHFLRGWLSYSRLWYVGRTRSEGKARPSRFSRHWLGGGPKMIQL
ncbi:hypothetical protein HHK36_013914 [Tetracentron sinense]|uniref:SNRNP25 ubiquitin-like domain-containing protein n=1 Tax=Tetracentron sinense TaxID=13715 RepID=A0A834Z709_TETSI|nr:hypothetical protein HHK36_013914 [Tetracentron sinense]